MDYVGQTPASVGPDIPGHNYRGTPLFLIL